jgi:hypothetical protein
MTAVTVLLKDGNDCFAIGNYDARITGILIRIQQLGFIIIAGSGHEENAGSDQDYNQVFHNASINC